MATVVTLSISTKQISAGIQTSFWAAASTTIENLIQLLILGPGSELNQRGRWSDGWYVKSS